MQALSGGSFDCSNFLAEMGKPGSTQYLILIVIALVLCRATDQVLYYRIAEAMSDYNWYFSAIILPIAFLFVVWPVVGYKLLFTGHITKAMLAVPQHKFAVLGLIDTLFNILSTWPIKYTGSTVANVLSQAVLPWNMVLAFIVLRTRYNDTHILGATMVIYGVLVRLLPSLLNDSDGEDETESAGLFLIWSIILMASQGLSALSNVYKEVALKDSADLDVFYMNACISTWQLIFGLATVPMVGLKFTPDYVPLSELGQYFKDANTCFFGHNPSASITSCSEDVTSPLVIFCFFIGFNIAYNVLMLEVFKRGSSVLFAVASAARLPVVDIMLMSGFLAGTAKEMFSAFDGFALVALLVGLYMYNAKPEISSKRAPLGLIELCTGTWRHIMCCECACFEEMAEDDNRSEHKRLLGKPNVQILGNAPGASATAAHRFSHLDDTDADLRSPSVVSTATEPYETPRHSQPYGTQV